MKPKTNSQLEISRLVGYLPVLTNEHKEWAKLNCFPAEAIRRKNGDVYCSLCGYQWKSDSELADTVVGITCPHCQSELKAEYSKRRTIDTLGYMTIVDVVGEYQVLRHFLVNKVFKLGENFTLDPIEVVQLWFNEDGKCIPITRARSQNSSWCRQPFSLSKPMNFRSRIIEEYKIWGDVYPNMYITDKLKKRGLTSFYGCNPYHLVGQLLSGDTKTETLIKTGQYDLLIAYTSTSREREVIRYWNQVRIATKHKYIVSDPTMWLDYLDILSEFRKDLNNPQLICPNNLKHEHDRYIKKKLKIDKERERLRKVQEAETAARKQQMFEERIKRFLDLKIKDEDIEIVPLRSIDEFKAEGELMHHCVFASKYFERLDCLILSAKIGEEHIETIEVDLLKWQVVQSRGKFNQPTPYHDKIVNLVKSNINLIKRIA